jgi:hypothetical protein
MGKRQSKNNLKSASRIAHKGKNLKSQTTGGEPGNAGLVEKMS